MQLSVLSLLALAAIGNGHSIFQQLQVNGVSQGLLTGVRSPDSNYPITDVTSSSLTCNTGIHMPVSTAVITIPAGAQVAAQWGHVIGGQQFANDPDNPIASSHHGPVIYWLAKVATGTAGTAATTGLQWFKVYQDTLTNGVWGVDNMIANGGWSKFTLPSCIAPGDYLLRVEIIALHNAYNQAGAQFYNSCSNIRVTGSGTFTGSGFVSLPGAYSATDPGILINIYDASGNPTNGGKPYTAPGGPVQACPAGGTKPTSTSSTVKPTTTAAPTTTTSKSTAQPTSTSSGGAALYGQCGGQGWTGPTTCASGKCTVSNAYYSQCLP